MNCSTNCLWECMPSPQGGVVYSTAALLTEEQDNFPVCWLSLPSSLADLMAQSE